MSEVVMSKEVLRRLADLGIVDWNRVQRVVIDLQVGEVAMVYVSNVGDTRLLDVAECLSGVQVVTEG